MILLKNAITGRIVSEYDNDETLMRVYGDIEGNGYAIVGMYKEHRSFRDFDLIVEIEYILG